MTPTILDGGFSRELIRLGAPFKQPEWSALALIEGPEYVRQVHQAFVESGADVITTNSYALVPFHIGEERFRAQGEQLAILAGKLAREVADESTARGRNVLVAGSLPPIFGSYEPDKFDPKRVQDYLSVLVRGLAPYVDFWLGETLSLVAEAEAVREAIRDFEKPLWISFTLDDSSRNAVPTLTSGEPVEKTAQWALDAGVKAILFNCSRAEVMAPAIQDTHKFLASHSTSPPAVGVYANAFASQPQGAANEGLSATREDLDPHAYLQCAREWIAQGATIVGGCCGIGCEHIQVLANELKPVS